MIRALLISLLFVVSAQSYANKINVKVGAGIRPPFLLHDNTGMGPDIINTFNVIQSQFQFELVAVPIGRRPMSLKESWVDIIMWDNVNWGWDDNLNLTASEPLLHSQDIFISHASSNKNQNYFNNFKGKVICAVNGYHYKCMDYQTDYNTLKNKFNIILVRTEEESIKMALFNRCDISAVSQSALNWFFTSQPDSKKELIISERFDTRYSRSFLVPSFAPITAAELNNLFVKAKSLGLLAPIYEKYGQQLN